ncbi:MAG: hypothetical protein EOP37_11195 [Rubrivivax sp.]|nr:MAG: hypothetical protein EOP37_11195 [Rubrivivax sp.]
MDAARSSADDYDRWVGLRISAICAAVPLEPVTDETVRVSVAGGEERQRAVLSAAQHAHRNITQFCGSGDAWRYLAEVKEHKLNIGAIGPSSRLLTAARPEERAQWAPVVLASPQRYGAAAELLFEDILARNLPAELRSDPDAAAFAADALSQELLHTDPAESVSALTRCAIELRCAGHSGLTPDQMRAIKEVVARIELNVREQRWSNL